MSYVFALFVVAFPCVVSASNVVPNNVAGIWRASWVAVKGEQQTLIISENMSSTFTRIFNDGKKQIFEASKLEIVDDLIIVKYESKDKASGYKLVLSGWSRESKSVLYGTMFMYKSGEQFNGLPVTFQRE